MNDTNQNWVIDEFDDPCLTNGYTMATASWAYPYLQDDPFFGTDIIGAFGVSAQGNGNPPSQFDFHKILKRNGVYYDASYGVKVMSLLEWQNSSLDGFWSWGKSIRRSH